jgi:DNA-binding NarL/FixJ family response regulator
MDLLSEGLDDETIARRLGVSATTVRRHVGTAAQKLGASRRSEAIDRYLGVTDGTALAA